MKEIKYILLLIFCLYSWNANAQSSGWKWAKEGRGNNLDEGVSVCTDPNGNVYIIGYYRSSWIIFGSHILTNTTSSFNWFDMYVVKYDPLGNVIWAKSYGNIYDDWGLAITSDPEGNIYITGTFYSPTITFDSYTLTKTGTEGTGDVFVAKMDSDGNILWAKSASGGIDDIGWGISADAFGHVYITGFFSSDSVTFGTHTLYNLGSSNTFMLVKYDSSGNVLWAKSAGLGVRDMGYSVCNDREGNVFVTGLFQSSSITFGSFNLTLTGTQSIFIAKYDSLGNVLWAKSPGGPDVGLGYSVCTDKFGNLYTTGSFNSPSVTFGGTTLTGAGNNDIYLAKYNTLGNVLWAKSFGSAGNEVGFSVSADSATNIYLMGAFNFPLALDTFALTPPPADCPFIISCDPSFIAKLDSDGNALCAASLSSGGDDPGAVTTDRFGNAYMVGDFTAINFYVGSDTLELNFAAEITFLAKYNCNSTENVTEIQKDNDILVFPNPSNGNFSLFITAPGCSIQIVDVLGKQVYSNKTTSSTTEINLDNLNDGVYFIKANKGNYLYSKKIVIHR